MPVVAPELVTLGDGLFLWQAYDPAVKAELFSTAVVTENDQVVLVDPILLDESELNRLSDQSRIAALVITNVNHRRAAAWFAKKFSVPIFTHRASFADEQIAQATFVTETEKIADELEVIELEGAAPGEIAMCCAANGGTLIIGDALINFPPHGFTLLPRKYCTNANQLRYSLGKLLEYRVERILFAHGAPILSGATARLRKLLTVEP
jgi:glyoxylase-like metal-dependent hydrolase (beta-lactamase superfamily II)